MRKNTAGQVIVAQLINKADGTPCTSGTTTCYVLGDGGTQAAGSVGSGACTHEGNGLWSYAPAQAESNYDHVAFTFVNTNAVNATIQIYTSFPQTGDNYARLGAPAGASVSADVAAVKAVLPAALVSGRIDASVGAMASGVLTATAIAADAITDAKVASDVTIASVTGAVGSVTGAVGSVATGGITAASFAADAITAAKVAADVTTEIAAGVRTELATELGRIDAAVSTRLASASYSAPPSAAAVADAVWDEAIAGHAGAGSTGEALAAAGSAGDPWTTALPGSYSAGQAGYIVGTNLNATVSSRLASASYTAPLDAAGTRSAVGLASANLDTQIGTLATAVNLATVATYIDTEVAAIKAKTDNLPAAPAATGDIPSAATVASAVRTELSTELARVDVAVSTRNATAPLDAAGTRTAVGLASANLDTQLGAVATASALTTVGSNVTAVKAKTDNLPASPAATGDIPSAASIAAEVWASVVEGSATALQYMRGFASVLLGKASGLGTTTAVYRDVPDTKARVTATVDADGNRTAVTRDLT